MTTDMITLKLERKFLKQIDRIVDKEGYQSRTEFIRNSLREKVSAAEKKEIIAHLSKYYGIAKDKKTSEEKYRRDREMAANEIERMIDNGEDQKKYMEKFFKK